MKSNKKIRVKVGDVFQIPIDDSHISFGQVLVNNSGVLRIATFKKKYKLSDTPSIEQIVTEPILLLTDTMDAKIWSGDWKVYGNTNVISDSLPKPRFKLGMEPVYITNYEQTRKRIASADEANILDHKFSVSPIRIQNGRQAYFGIKEWDDDFDKLTLEYCIEKSKINI